MEKVNCSLFLAVICSMQDLRSQKERKKSPSLFFQKVVCCAEPLERARASARCAVTSVTSDSLRPHALQPARLLCPWGSPGKNNGAGGHALLQGILPDPGMASASPMSPALAGGFFTLGHFGRPPLTHMAKTHQCPAGFSLTRPDSDPLNSHSLLDK